MPQMRSQEIPDIFCEKGPVIASSHRPSSDGARMEFYRIPTEFLLAILCAFTALTMRTLCFHGIRTVMTVC